MVFARRTSFQKTNHLANTKLWRIAYIEVNMLLTHQTSDNMDTILITYLSDELTCAQTHFLCQYLISVLGDPDKVHPVSHVPYAMIFCKTS